MILKPLTLSAVQASVVSAVVKHGKEYTPLSETMDDKEKLAILCEEVGEVAHLLTYDAESDTDKLVKELLQVAAVALMWVEAKDAHF